MLFAPSRRAEPPARITRRRIYLRSLMRNLIRRERRGSHIIDGRDRLQVREHRPQIGFGHILVHGPWHWRKNVAAISSVFAGAERLDEHLGSPAPQTRGLVRR